MKGSKRQLASNIILVGILAIHIAACSKKQLPTIQVDQLASPSTAIMLQRAEDMIAQKKWDEARAVLKILEKHCAADRRCIAKRQFMLGYFFQQQGREFDSAVIYYNKVLEQYPLNSSLYKNIAITHQQQGDTSKAIEVLEKAVEKGLINEIARELGYLYEHSKQYERANKLYVEALEESPLSRSLHERILATYSRGYSNAANIVSHGEQMMKLGFDDLAVSAFAEAMKRHGTNEEMAEKALFLWIIASSRLAVVDIDRIPKDWTHEGLDQLRALITMREKPSALNLTWWKSPGVALQSNRPHERPLPRTAIIGYVLHYVGYQFEIHGAIDLADDAYEYAYRIISGDNIRTFLKRPDDIPDIFYEIAGARGMLLTKYPEVDRQGNKFGRMENELFEGKGAAYLQGQTEIIMKFHTTLGLIYAARNQWQPFGYRNGLYQLNSAISKSPEEKNTGYLNILLAYGYLQNNNRKQALVTFMKAAVDFLNDDDFSSCKDALRLYDSLNGEKNRSYILTNKLLNLRTTLETVADNELNDIKAFTSWVYETTTEADSKFAQLQRFKIFSDAGSVSLQRGRPNVGYYYHSLALLTSDSLDALTNLTDITRLNEQIKSVSASVHFEQPIAAAIYAWSTDEKLSKRKIWKIYEAGSSFETREIGLATSSFTGALVARAVNANESRFKDGEEKFLITAEGDIYEISMPRGERSMKRHTDFKLDLK